MKVGLLVKVRPAYPQEVVDHETPSVSFYRFLSTRKVTAPALVIKDLLELVGAFVIGIQVLVAHSG
jgi:hypothetical protein